MMLGIPAVLYIALQYGACLSWVSVVATTESNAFSTDPYNFTTIVSETSTFHPLLVPFSQPSTPDH